MFQLVEWDASASHHSSEFSQSVLKQQKLITSVAGKHPRKDGIVKLKDHNKIEQTSMTTKSPAVVKKRKLKFSDHHSATKRIKGLSVKHLPETCAAGWNTEDHDTCLVQQKTPTSTFKSLLVVHKRSESHKPRSEIDDRYVVDLVEAHSQRENVKVNNDKSEDRPRPTENKNSPFSMNKLRVRLQQQSGKSMATKKQNTKTDQPGKTAPVKCKLKTDWSPKNSQQMTGEKKDETSRSALFKERLLEKLTGAHFRHLNERLYTSNSKDAEDMFHRDKSAFQLYHVGYKTQVDKWPVNPVDKIIEYIQTRHSADTIVDLGCGDAKLAQSVNNTVYSYDLVALNPHVTVCNMAKVPLSKSFVDVVVFCLSLMGTNLVDYICEANRILKTAGRLIIAEVTSRFQNINKFVKQMKKLGFQLLEQDNNNKMFIMFVFKKAKSCSGDNLPEIRLLPCTYKRR